MAKKKISTALFEAISKSKEKQSMEGFAIPNWMAGESQSQQVSQTQPSASVPPGQSVAKGVAAGAEQSEKKILLTPRKLAAIGAAAVIAMLAVYFFGKKNAPPTVVETVIDQPAEVDNQALPGGDESLDRLPARVPGKYYLVIQAVPGKDKADGVKIAQWLWNEKKEPAEVRPLTVEGRRLYIVWSLRPLDSFQGAAAMDFARHIESMGQEYKEKYGKYWFKQRDKQGKLDPWYKKEPEPAK